MINSSYKKFFLPILAFSIVVGIFSYFRLEPILNERVAYTFDQGRDFLKASEIVINKDITFIGPTTGINGIFHGAWWYYYLAIVFAIFGGLPMGFYIMQFILYLSSLLFLIYFLNKYFNNQIALLFGLVISTSPYFITKSLFVANNTIVPVFVLLFLVTHFLILEKLPNSNKRKLILFFIAGLSLGMIAEFEFAFGLLLMPVYILTAIILKPLRKKFMKISQSLFFFGGLFIAFLPRLLFEIRNNFSQTRTLLSFFTDPQYHTPKTINSIFSERIHLFYDYYSGIYSHHWIMWIFSFMMVFSIVIMFKRKKVIFHNSLFFLSIILLGLFLVSLLYKDTFWPYYFDGIHYSFILISAILLQQFNTVNQKQLKTLLYLLNVAIFLTAIYSVITHIKSPKIYDGIKVQIDIVGFIQKIELNLNNYCVYIYTPPVIPHTYDYLFKYNSISKRISEPKQEFVDNKCWYVLEADPYAERKNDWINGHLPKDNPNLKLIKEKQIKDVTIQLWDHGPTE